MKRCIGAFMLLISLFPSVFANPNLADLQLAVQNKDSVIMQRLQTEFEGSVLEMYPRYYLLDWQISDATEAQVSQFLHRYKTSPLAETLRENWLKELARREEWDHYRIEYLALPSPSTEQTCNFLQAELSAGNIGALQEKKMLWFSAKPQPAACDKVFERMRTEGMLSPDSVWDRLRLVLNTANLQFAVKIASTYLDSTMAEKIKEVAQAPYEQFILLDSSSRAGRELAIFSLDRMARTDPFLAARVLKSYQNKLPAEIVDIAWGRVGLIAAKKLMPEALVWFKNANTAFLPSEAREWLIRMAIRQDDWHTVQLGIESMPEAERQLSIWRYWHARALLGSQQILPGKKILSQLIKEENGYYGLLAREELGLVLEPMPDNFTPSKELVVRLKKLIGIQRALSLYKYSFWQAEAVQEWNHAMQNRSDEELLAASLLAEQIGWYDRAIYSAERTRVIHNYRMRFPTPLLYDKEIVRQASQHEIDPAWVYGLIRQESRFASLAKSRVGAMGLMQIMPATARWIAGRLGEKEFDLYALGQPLLNIQFGTYYLRYISERLEGSLIMATAAYNAGPNRPGKWLADRPLEGAKWIESIPFDETRDYVKKVMANAMHYAQRMNQGSTLLKQRLGTVPAKPVLSLIVNR